MIRRDDQNDWLLIRQVEHARLSAEIAAVWGNESVEPLPVPELLLPAIHDHDVGWKEWAASPGVDPETGCPRNFTEMPMAVSTALWSTSIEVCAAPAPLAGTWVSRHFCWLAEQARESRQDITEEVAAIDDFLDDQTSRQQAWRREIQLQWQEAAGNFSLDDVDVLILEGLQYVQFFDRVSLWLCCSPAEMPFDTERPGGESIRLTPGSSGRVVLTPYPLSVDRLELSVSAHRIEARRYANDAELQRAIDAAEIEELRWELTR
jgi:hypothetical protein